MRGGGSWGGPWGEGEDDITVDFKSDRIITTELAYMGPVVIITIMRPRTLTTGIVWLATLTMAAQGFGASVLVDACQCQTCECGQPVQEKCCCGSDGAREIERNCGQSCCLKTVGDCDSSVTTLGSCCCVGAELPTPLNPPKSDKVDFAKPLPQVMPAATFIATPSLNSCRQYETDIRHVSPPPRILYCVWRI